MMYMMMVYTTITFIYKKEAFLKVYDTYKMNLI